LASSATTIIAFHLGMTLHDERLARAADHAIDFAARREREAKRSYARRPKKIADVIAQLITRRGYGRIEANEQLAGAWSAAAGEPLATYSRPGKLRRGTLEVSVTNSTIMQEFSFQKQRILAELGRRMPDAKIRDLRFRVGTIQ
jgi:predicted nucleic acid-binding Zn ribbon protein